MDMLTQLNGAMEYIETNLDNDLIVEDVSRVTSYSPYHFGRLFYYIAGMTLTEYIRKRKLSLAAMALQNSSVKVIDLAVMYGYDSADSFTRAFVKQHGVTPTVARQVGIKLTLFPPLTFQIKVEGVRALNWRIEEIDAFVVFGIEKVFSNDETDRVPWFWDECRKDGSFERLSKVAATKPEGQERHIINAVCGYYEPSEDSFPYMICTLKEPESNTEGFIEAVIPKATWAIFTSEKTEEMGESIPELNMRIYNEWLPSSGYDKVSGPDMEVYFTDPDGQYYAEVWIPVTKA